MIVGHSKWMSSHTLNLEYQEIIPMSDLVSIKNPIFENHKSQTQNTVFVFFMRFIEHW